MSENTEETPKRKRGRPPKIKMLQQQSDIIADAVKNPSKTAGVIAKKHNVARSTVVDVLAKFGIKNEELQAFRESEPDLIADTRSKILRHLRDEKRLEKANFHQLSVSYGILIDKERLMLGQSTSIVSIAKILTDIERENVIDVTPK